MRKGSRPSTFNSIFKVKKNIFCGDDNFFLVVISLWRVGGPIISLTVNEIHIVQAIGQIHRYTIKHRHFLTFIPEIINKSKTFTFFSLLQPTTSSTSCSRLGHLLIISLFHQCLLVSIWIELGQVGIQVDRQTDRLDRQVTQIDREQTNIQTERQTDRHTDY